MSGYVFEEFRINGNAVNSRASGRSSYSIHHTLLVLINGYVFEGFGMMMTRLIVVPSFSAEQPQKFGFVDDGHTQRLGFFEL